MVSLKRCREILKTEAFTDVELQAILDGCVALANLALEAHAGGLVMPGVRRSANTQSGLQFQDLVLGVPPGDREAIEERAAIREFDGAVERRTAEITAFKDYLSKRNRYVNRFSNN